MGFYLEVPANHYKAEALVNGLLLVLKKGDPADSMEKFSSPRAGWEYAPPYEAEIVLQAPAWEDIPEGKMVVVVVNNGPFEAAGLAYSEREYENFTREDGRERTYVLIDRDIALRASGAPAS